MAPLQPGLPPPGALAEPPRSKPAVSRSSIVALIVLTLMLVLYLILK